MHSALLQHLIRLRDERPTNIHEQVIGLLRLAGMYRLAMQYSSPPTSPVSRRYEAYLKEDQEAGERMADKHHEARKRGATASDWGSTAIELTEVYREFEYAYGETQEERDQLRTKKYQTEHAIFVADSRAAAWVKEQAYFTTAVQSVIDHLTTDAELMRHPLASTPNLITWTNNTPTHDGPYAYSKKLRDPVARSGATPAKLKKAGYTSTVTLSDADREKLARARHKTGVPAKRKTFTRPKASRKAAIPAAKMVCRKSTDLDKFDTLYLITEDGAVASDGRFLIFQRETFAPNQCGVFDAKTGKRITHEELAAKMQPISRWRDMFKTDHPLVEFTVNAQELLDAARFCNVFGKYDSVYKNPHPQWTSDAKGVRLTAAHPERGDSRVTFGSVEFQTRQNQFMINVNVTNLRDAASRMVGTVTVKIMNDFVYLTDGVVEAITTRFKDDPNR